MKNHHLFLTLRHRLLSKSIKSFLGINGLKCPSCPVIFGRCAGSSFSRNCSWGFTGLWVVRFLGCLSYCFRSQSGLSDHYFLSVLSLPGIEVRDQVIELLLTLSNLPLYFRVLESALLDGLLDVFVKLSVSLQLLTQSVPFSFLLGTDCL